MKSWLNSDLPIIYRYRFYTSVTNSELNQWIEFDVPFSSSDDYLVIITPASFPGAWTNVRYQVSEKLTNKAQFICYGENNYQGTGWFDIVVIGN